MLNRKWVIQQVVARGPLWVGAALRSLPKPVSCFGLSQHLNWFFRRELTAGELDFLASKTVKVEVADLSYQFYLQLQQGRLNVLADGAEDVLFRANSQDLLQLITQQADPDTLFFRRKLALLGDTELALAVKNLLDTIELNERLPKSLVSLLTQLAAAVPAMEQGQLAEKTV
ncbi:SCP2 sterol-binding domain-containing protein [Alkalimonas sp. MEB108]|uniref:Ubiquinone biosynthesis accessory factor UbiT n=1 Tax=Alkalimonas cellulosilytica TaxID=3058395 RepID=A0ABU7J8Z1_9GAMM|nr:SCP2 sterol-binding domain-containing protein [Alkalimonas sp. MEB108]MEE2002345.1 SCP2 sterol-binding domain-containing protein [Alkalimonas sp. MEB108]